MLKLRKALGQHHLLLGQLCRPLLDFLQPAGARVVEIGPGGGVLTAGLIAAGARVVGFELDLAWALELRRRLPTQVLAVVAGDALDITWAGMPQGTLVAGNLPYHVATPMICRVLDAFPRIPRAAFLVQKEVAERLVARPGSKAYGGLSLFVAARAEARLLGALRPASFRPPPKVDSAFVGFTARAPGLEEAVPPGFDLVVRLAFGQRRKTLRNALSAGWGKQRAQEVIAAAGLSPTARAEELDLTEFLLLSRAASRQV